MQSTSLHAAIIMDGNGRWAAARARPRADGHRAGAEAARRVVKAAPGLGIGVLTLYAFSSDNWQRPVLEVEGLMGLLAHFFREESTACRDAGVRLTAIGRRDRLPAALRGAIAAAERITVGGDRLWLRVAIDYSSRDQILRAAEELLRASRRGGVGHRGLTRGRLGAMLGAAPDVDLLIRTGGERRLSDFLLWEAAYAELIFTEVAWPDFTEQHLQAAVAEFSRRDRRFGRVAEGRGA
jgi:undecaprenyl diphosphate synthase